MKKKILSIALIAMSLVAFTGVAQNNTTDNTAAKTCCGDKKDCPMASRSDFNPFEGITLSETQQAQLKELQAKRAADRKQKMEQAKADKQQKCEANRIDRKASKKEYLEQVKAILGPDQYVVFLENMVVNGQQGGPRKMEMRRGDRKDNMQARKGDMHRGGHRNVQKGNAKPAKNA